MYNATINKTSSGLNWKGKHRNPAEPCKYENKINETHKIVTGNGDPEKGLGRQVALINERQNGIFISLQTINNNLKEVNENHNVLLGEITRVGSSLNEFKSSINGEEKIKKEQQVKNRDNWYKGLTIAGLVIVIVFGIWNHFTNVNGIKETIATKDTLKQEIRLREGVSKVTRGGWVKYNDFGLSDSIKIKE